MSFGIDARIGMGFDKNRKKSVIGNKCIYAWEGLKKMFIKTKKMKDTIKKVFLQKGQL